MSLKNSNIQHPEYSEPAALQELLLAANEAVEEANDKADIDRDYLNTSFNIDIGGRSIAILLGGPQYQALINFVESIAAENGYLVNPVDGTVTE